MKLLFGILTVITALALLAAPAMAAEVFQPNYYENSLTNGVTTVTNGTTLAVTTKPFTLIKDRGFAAFPLYVGNHDVTNGTFTLNYNVTYDGTNWTTSNPIQQQFALFGTNVSRGFTNVPPVSVNNARQARLTSITVGGTNNVTFTNIIHSWSKQ